MNSIVLKLGIAILLLPLVVLCPLGYVVDKAFSTFYFKKAVENLNVQSERMVRLIISSENQESIQSIGISMQMTNNGVALLNASGQVITKANLSIKIEEILSSDEWATLSKGFSIINHRITPVFMLVGKPIMLNDHFNGVVFHYFWDAFIIYSPQTK